MQPQVCLLKEYTDLCAHFVSHLCFGHIYLSERPILSHQLPKVAVLSLLKLVLLQTESLELGINTKSLAEDLYNIVEVCIQILSHQRPDIAKLIELTEYVFKILRRVSRTLR